MKNKNLIIGYGRLGQKIYALNQENYDWITIRRHLREPLATINQDILSIDLSALKEIDTIIFSMAPSEHSQLAYEDCYLKSLKYILKNTFFKKIIFCSSTGVYAQQEGESVDETSITAPSHFSGKILLEAEDLIKEFAPSSYILRLSGLYDGSKLPPSSWKTFSTWSNRIHIEDAASIISHLLDKNSQEHETFCITDNLPFIPQEIASLFYLDENVFFKSERAISSKKVINLKIKEYLNYHFIYESIFEGYKKYLRT